LNRSTTRGEWIFLCAFFGSLAAYCLYGAVTDSLFIPAKRGPGPGGYLSGSAAWSLFGAVTMIWAGIAIRLGLMNGLPSSVRTAIEMVLLTTGVGLMLLSGHLHNACAQCAS
jgi:hypothetical protein